MTMICFDVDGARFNYRVAGIALRDNQVLLNCLEGENYWFLPGGRVDMGESSREGLRREMQEELQEEVQVGQLLWIAEDFFTSESGKAYHELGFYYRMDFSPEASIYKIQEVLLATDGHTRLVFQWVPLTELEHIVLYPPFLIQGLQQLPEQTVHILDGR